MSSRVPLYIFGLSLVKWAVVVSDAQAVVKSVKINMADTKRLFRVIIDIAPSLFLVSSLLRQRNVGVLDQSPLEGNRFILSCFAIDRRSTGKNGVDRYGYCFLP
jgi:hypothetical protein